MVITAPSTFLPPTTRELGAFRVDLLDSCSLDWLSRARWFLKRVYQWSHGQLPWVENSLTDIWRKRELTWEEADTPIILSVMSTRSLVLVRVSQQGMRLAFCSGQFIVRDLSKRWGMFIITQILVTIENMHASPVTGFACKSHLKCLEPQWGTQRRPHGTTAWVRLVTGMSSSGACKYSITNQPRLQRKGMLLPKHSSLHNRSSVRTEKKGPMHGAIRQ